MTPRARELRTCAWCGYRDISVYRPRHGLPICAECWKSRRHKAVTEGHHLYGRSKDVVLPTPVNLHAYLTEEHEAWPDVLKVFPDDPLLRVAYVLRMMLDLIRWLLVHVEELDTLRNFQRFFKAYGPAALDGLFSPVRGQLNRMLHWISLNLEACSDWLIALQAFLVREYGQDYQDRMGIASLPFIEPGKDE